MGKSKNILIFVAVLILALIGEGVGLYFQLRHVGWGPLARYPQSLKAKKDGFQRRINDAQAKIDQIPGREEELATLEKDEKVADQLLPRASRPDELLQFIRRKAKEANVSPQSITPSVSGVGGGSAPSSPFGGPGDAGGSKYQKWSFAIVIKGTYDEIGTFVNKMEEFEISLEGSPPEKRFFRVTSLDIAATDGGMSEGVRHTCNLQVETFRYVGGPSGG